MSKVTAWRLGAPGEPEYADDFDVEMKAVLQVTDLKTNRNKYYAIELHAAASGAQPFRVFTHYGRTDDLETNPNAGAKESRYFEDRASALACYQSVFNEKTSPRKGYKEVSLASSRIGSHKARGSSSGAIDEKTLERIEGEKERRANRPPSTLTPAVQDFTRYIYDEATQALTTTIAAKITAQGIETPLGVLTLGQIEKGETILAQLYGVFTSTKKQSEAKKHAELERLTGEFYTCVPHRVGRTRSSVEASVIDTLDAFEQKQNTLQLMKDMLQVNGDAGSVLYEEEIDAKYQALRCTITELAESSAAFREIRDLVVGSQIKSKTIAVKRVFAVRRDEEYNRFTSTMTNQRLLFHGSRIQNWVGLLSRGIVLPKIAVSMGVNRTDAGWLGNGIYFGDAACTSAFYTTPGKRRTRIMAVCRVALGKPKPYHKITYGLTEPPAGFDSCHGVRSKMLSKSEFADDEYVIYRTEQQRIEYVVEFTA